jgi:hypothetical protein
VWSNLGAYLGLDVSESWIRRVCSRVESVVEEAVKGSDAAEGIVEEVVGERHLVDDSGGKVVSPRV